MSCLAFSCLLMIWNELNFNKNLISKYDINHNYFNLFYSTNKWNSYKFWFLITDKKVLKIQDIRTFDWNMISDRKQKVLNQWLKTI